MYEFIKEERGAYMSKTYIPEGYNSVLTLYETQNAIGVIHHAFEEHLGQTLNLKRVSAPPVR